jgi:hypothetical protein
MSDVCPVCKSGDHIIKHKDGKLYCHSIRCPKMSSIDTHQLTPPAGEPQPPTEEAIGRFMWSPDVNRLS